jgi:hypothetical protein
MELLAVSFEIRRVRRPIHDIPRNNRSGTKLGVMFLAEPRLRMSLQRERESCWIIIGAMAEYPHAVRPGEHEIQPAAHCCYRVPAPALGRELRMDAVEASAMRHENKPPVLRPQSEVSLVGEGWAKVQLAFAAKPRPDFWEVADAVEKPRVEGALNHGINPSL